MPARLSRGTATLAALGTVAALGLSACGSDSSTTSSNAKTDAAHKIGKVSVTMADNSCSLSTDSVKAGPVTFTVLNKSATGITEVELLQDQRILGEKENLAPGLGAESFTLTLDGGKYQVYCPGADKEMTDLTVTGKAAVETGSTQTLLADGAKQYGTYVTGQVQLMQQNVKVLQAKIDAGDLAAAQKAYGQARPYYERIESDVEGFHLPGYKVTDNRGFLDYLIDMRASNLDPKVGWHGFHAIERDLFGRKQITASTKSLAAELTKNVGQLASLSKTLTYKPETLANGAVSLLEEVQHNKITGEEEDFSHIDLVDFAANVEGAMEAFAYLRPGLNKIDASMAASIAQNFTKVENMLDTYRDPHAVGGYKIYTAALKRKDGNQLSQSVQSLQDSLAQLAEKVTAG